MVTQVKKFYLIASNLYRKKILSLIYDFGEIQVIELEEKAEKQELGDLEYRLAQVKSSISFLNNYRAKEKINLKNKINKMFAPKLEISAQEVNRVVERSNWQTTVARIEDLNKQLNDNLNKIKKIEEEKQRFIPWRNLEINPREFQSFKKVFMILGKIAFSDEKKFIEELKQKFNLVEIKKISVDEKYAYFFIVFAKELAKELSTFLDEQKFIKEDLNISLTVKEKIDRLEEELKNAHQLVEQSENELRELAKKQDDLKIVFDWLSWQRDKEEINQMAAQTNYTFFLVGWIELKRFNLLKDKVSQITNEFEIIEAPIKEDENIPILLKNKTPINDFENVTGIYGFPRYDEPDPTPFLTPFFIIFFAICLSDAGYGIILTLLSLFIIAFFKLPASTIRFFRLFLWLGLATIVAGALFGSWFSVDLESLPMAMQSIKNFLLKIKIIDPVKNPIDLLIISLILGVIQIIAGFFVNMYWKIKNKMIIDGLLDNFPWISFFTFILLFVAASVGFFKIDVNLIKYFIFASLAVIVITGGRKNKNVVMKIFGGLPKLYSIIGYFSDTLSYSRLLALGLATSIVGMVMNLVAQIFSGLIPGIGVVLAVLILVGGHIFNIAISSLGAFIHSARLQFVEFFPKFMEGGGSKFKLFQKEGKYIRLLAEK